MLTICIMYEQIKIRHCKNKIHNKGFETHLKTNVNKYARCALYANANPTQQNTNKLSIHYFQASTHTTSYCFLKQLWDSFGIVFGQFWIHFGIVLGSFWDNVGISLGSVWDRFPPRSYRLMPGFTYTHIYIYIYMFFKG